MYFALQDITSLAKDDKREKEKKIRDRLCNCFEQKEQQSVISPSIALLNSSLKNTTNNDVRVFPLA